jgi:probable F420-dependent oxidoreductase
VDDLQIDAMLPADDLGSVAVAARRLEAAGFPRVYVAEGNHDPFVVAAVASQHLEAAELGMDVAIAFARSPMTVAHSAWDLQTLTNGRFVLGLGSQVRGHIVRRFSMPWSSPAARMREYVLALRAIWAAWAEGRSTAFEGEYYRHTLVGPPFSPGANPFGPPPILLAGVGPRMVEVAGEVADGFLTHPFNTPESISQVVLPALERGRRTATTTVGSFDVVAQFMVVTGRDQAELDAGRDLARARVAFYGSTPAYKDVLGDSDLQDRLHRLSREGRWSDMAGLVTDDLLDRVIIVGEPAEAVRRARTRAAGWAGRIVLLPQGAVTTAGPDALNAWNEEILAAASVSASSG